MMNGRKDRALEAVHHSKQSILPNHDKSVDNIWEKLKRRAGQLDYGSLLCEVQVHKGQIRQIEVTVIKEKIRAD